MNYNINYVESFAKELKKLSKKYRSLKNDYKNLLQILSKSDNPKNIGISIGKNCYKIRLKNSDNMKGKSGGYRVIYFVIDENQLITLLSIYSKSDLDNISENVIDDKIIEKLKGK